MSKPHTVNDQPLRSQLDELQKTVVALSKQVENNSSAFVGPDFSGQELFKFYVQACIKSALCDVRLKTLANPDNQDTFVKQIVDTAKSLCEKTLDALS